MPIQETPTLYNAITDQYVSPYPYERLVEGDFPGARSFFEESRTILAFVDERQKMEIIDKFRRFDNLENGEEGTKASHRNFVDYLYSRNNLPCIAAIHEYALKTGDREALTSSSDALLVLSKAMDAIDKYAAKGMNADREVFITADGGVDYQAVFSSLMARSSKGNSNYSTFMEMMRLARIRARECLWRNKDKPIDDYVMPYEHFSFKERSKLVIEEFEEAKRGVSMSQHIIDRLKDSATQALVISVDYNSTWNKKESFSDTHLTAVATDNISSWAHFMARHFPHIKLYVVMNTGRPEKYLWGVMDSLNPIPALRRFALAECGGVVRRKDVMLSGEGEVAVENPRDWKSELDRMREYLREVIANGRDTEIVRFEDKQSMVSLQVTPRNSNGDDWIHRSKDGEQVSDQWLGRKVIEYLSMRRANLISERNELMRASEPQTKDRVFAVLQRYGANGMDGIKETEDNFSGDVIAEIQKLFDEHDIDRAVKLDENTRMIAVVDEMQNNLQTKFNPTAGFADIAHRGINKYSTLRRELIRDGVDIENAIFIHEGDSLTDDMPAEVDDEGNSLECNAGADRVLQIAVADSSKAFLEETLKRGDYGIVTARNSILGLIDTFEGLREAAIHARDLNVDET